MIDLSAMTDKQLEELRHDLDADLDTEASHRRGEAERDYFDKVRDELEAVEIELQWRYGVAAGNV